MIGSAAIAISMLTFTVVPEPVTEQTKSQPKFYKIKKPKLEITINAEAAGNEFPIVKLRVGPGCASSRRWLNR